MNLKFGDVVEMRGEGKHQAVVLHVKHDYDAWMVWITQEGSPFRPGSIVHWVIGVDQYWRKVNA